MSTDPAHVTKGLGELKQGWYSVTRLCEGLGRYRPTEEGFTESLDTILSGIEGFERLLDDFYRSIIHSFPAHPEKIESQRNEILEEIADLKETMRGGQERVVSLKEKDGEIIKAKLEELQELYGELERETAKRCNKYFERKREYAIDFEKVERGVSKRIEAIRGAFIEKISEIIKGHEITFHERDISIEGLFDISLEDPEIDIEGVHIKPLDRGGFLDTITGTVAEREKAKESVLKYEMQNIVQKALPLKKKETELIAKLDRKFNDLRGLEADCKKVEEKRKEVVDIRDRLRMELEEVNAVENLKDTYHKNFDEVTPKVESFISLIGIIAGSKTGTGEGHGELMEKVEAKEGELDSLKTKIGGGASKEELLECKERLEELKSRIRRLETEIERQIDAIER